MIDMTKWEQIAATEIHSRKKTAGRLGGKIAVVTGSAQGFGKGIAEELYREGACVVIADLNEPLAKTVAESLGARALAVKADVSPDQAPFRMPILPKAEWLRKTKKQIRRPSMNLWNYSK